MSACLLIKELYIMTRCVLLSFIGTLIVSLGSPAQANKSVYEWAFIRLDSARDEKVQQLRRFCDNTHKQAQRINNDQVMLNFFDVNNTYFKMLQNGSAPDNLKRKVEEFRKELRDYYVANYLSFHNILFINETGDIFYSIRKESDYHKNIFAEELAKTSLSMHLSKYPKKEVFVDFHCYGASGEPAAFFIEPTYKEGKHIGWFVLQCTINKVNSLFAGAERLGMTGETFLVNRAGYLLTESSFTGDSTILRMHLNNKNIKAKFREKKASKIVTDYRGFTVLTSFDVFRFLGTEWLIVAKVDEAQVITEHFNQYSNFYFGKIAHQLSEDSLYSNDDISPEYDCEMIMVDMDEFVKAGNGELLQTVGVSSCTAFIATYPGKFGYMAHISPFDKMYDGEATNLLGHIIKKIKDYDIYKYERRRMHFTVIARHLDTMENIVSKLISEGFLLSQINILYCPKAKFANIVFDYSENLTNAEWLSDKPSARKITHNPHDKNNLGMIVKKFLVPCQYERIGNE